MLPTMNWMADIGSVLSLMASAQNVHISNMTKLFHYTRCVGKCTIYNRISLNYGRSCINMLVAGIKLTVTTLLYSTVLHMSSAAIRSHRWHHRLWITRGSSTNKCLSCLATGMKNHWKEINTWATIWGNMICEKFWGRKHFGHIIWN